MSKLALALELTVGLPIVALIGAGFWFGLDHHDKNVKQENKLRWNKSAAVRIMPPTGIGPYQQDQADEALKKLSIPPEFGPFALAYQIEGTDRVGCSVVSSKATAQSEQDSKARTVAEACAEAGKKYQTAYAQEVEHEKAPSFSKTPFAESLDLAEKAVPPGTWKGDPTKVLPLLAKAKFPADKEVVIVSWNSYDEKVPLQGCVLVGTMGTFKASAKTEVSACEKVISMAKTMKM